MPSRNPERYESRRITITPKRESRTAYRIESRIMNRESDQIANRESQIGSNRESWIANHLWIVIRIVKEIANHNSNRGEVVCLFRIFNSNRNSNRLTQQPTMLKLLIIVTKHSLLQESRPGKLSSKTGGGPILRDEGTALSTKPNQIPFWTGRTLQVSLMGERTQSKVYRMKINYAQKDAKVLVNVCNPPDTFPILVRPSIPAIPWHIDLSQIWTSWNGQFAKHPHPCGNKSQSLYIFSVHRKIYAKWFQMGQEIFSY